MKWHPSDPARWSQCGLSDPDPTGRVAKTATVADALAYALVAPNATDPIDGILQAVRLEMVGLAEVLGDSRVADVVELLARRLEVAMLLLAWSDNRSRMPTEPDPDATEDGTSGDEGDG